MMKRGNFPAFFLIGRVFECRIVTKGGQVDYEKAEQG